MSDQATDPKGTIITELDSLRYTLNSGPEFQQDISILNEPHAEIQTEPQPTANDQGDLFQLDNEIIHDLDVPILTDPYEENSSPITETSIEAIETTASIETAESIEVTEAVEATETPKVVEAPEANLDIEMLNKESDSSVLELEQVLDELVAEQLPKLEQQLRDQLRQELEAELDSQENLPLLNQNM